MDRDGKTGVHLDGSVDVGVSRLEVIEGPSGRHQRTKAERARIAAECLMPECVASSPMLAELVLEDGVPGKAAACGKPDLQIVVRDVVIRVGAGVDERQLTRAIARWPGISATRWRIGPA